MDEQTVVITGATGGVGGAAAQAFAAEDATIVLAARDTAVLDERVAELEETASTVQAVRTDVRDEFDCERLAETASQVGETSGIDVIVPAAGVYHGDPGSTPTGDESYTTVDDHWRTNVRGVYATIREARPHLTDGARVLVPTGRVARKPKPGVGSYAISKAGAEAVARGFATDTSHTVGCLDLGQLATDLTGGQGRDPSSIGPMFVWAATDADPADIDGAVVDLKTWKRATR